MATILSSDKPAGMFGETMKEHLVTLCSANSSERKYDYRRGIRYVVKWAPGYQTETTVYEQLESQLDLEQMSGTENTMLRWQ
jgi:hypothetical protein